MGLTSVLFASSARCMTVLPARLFQELAKTICL
jgi:hypothetical protein